MASLRETLSAISAEIATYQAQIDTARERETNRANASARERMVEAESGRTRTPRCWRPRRWISGPSAAPAPEILEYRFQQDVLERLATVADRLPQVVQIGTAGGRHGGLPGDLAAYDRDGRRAPVHAEAATA